jgi:hypothetical protein
MKRLRWTILVSLGLTVTLGCSADISNPGGVSTPGGSNPDGSGGSGAMIAANGARPVNLEGAPIYSRFLRLTNAQWENSVRYLLNLSAPTGLSENFQRAVSGTTDFDNNERVVIVDNAAWSDFRGGAEAVVGKVTATDQALQQVVATTDPATFIKAFGRRAFRRDLTTDELTQYQTMFTEGSAYSGSQSAFTKGAALVMTAILQSPHFLYREELGDDAKPLNGYELASKLSLWMRDTIPTDAMLDAAQSGAFDTVDGAVAQATQMLEDPAARAVLKKFHDQLYGLHLVDTITKDKVDGFDPASVSEFKQASVEFFDHLFAQNLGVKDLLTSNVGFAGPALAKLYGVSVQGSGIQQVQLPGRAGWYSQIPFLALWGVNNDPDSIHRGVRINLDSLCADPGTPNIELPPVPPLQPNQTNRERYELLTGGCGATCHGQIINPIGFAFEGFDGLGRFRTMDQGKPVNTSSTYPFAEGTKDFNGPEQLMGFVAGGNQAHQCYAKKMASYALERDLVEQDRPLVQSLGNTSLSTAASFKQVMLALVKTDAFRTHLGGAK